MKKISKIAVVVLVVAALLVYIGNTRKGSRAWVERKVENMEKVYPTENLEDLYVHYIEVRKDRLTFLERVMEKKD